MGCCSKMAALTPGHLGPTTPLPGDEGGAAEVEAAWAKGMAQLQQQALKQGGGAGGRGGRGGGGARGGRGGRR